MTMLWPMEPTVAASDFDPFTKEVAMPVTVQSTSTRVRATAKPGATTRPVLRNLLEMGLACGDGAEELEGRLQEADAAKRQADKAAGAAVDACSNPGDDDGATTAPDPRAIAAATSALQSMHQRRSRLAEELETLGRQEAALKAALLRLLGRGRPPAEPERPAPSPGTGLPTAAWR
jgi:hypothetical protein